MSRWGTREDTGQRCGSGFHHHAQHVNLQDIPAGPKRQKGPEFDSWWLEEGPEKSEYWIPEHEGDQLGILVSGQSGP